jgi:hypothetical protein
VIARPDRRRPRHRNTTEIKHLRPDRDRPSQSQQKLSLDDHRPPQPHIHAYDAGLRVVPTSTWCGATAHHDARGCCWTVRRCQGASRAWQWSAYAPYLTAHATFAVSLVTLDRGADPTGPSPPVTPAPRSNRAPNREQCGRRSSDGRGAALRTARRCVRARHVSARYAPRWPQSPTSIRHAPNKTLRDRERWQAILCHDRPNRIPTGCWAP